ncbi:hypothetical protein DOF42_07030 [Salmonella enterica]|nr:hypothetical protein [Salmonella enterica]EAW1254631.1 hypothetical protein [Salmonella enterica subsp. enterica]EDB5723224.1 hypothetical protein [Salmonella enterica subsp. enterica serovar Rubislaw]EBO4816111.1 hypothetical protein [Salmonella enterica]EBQ0854535.1 hypothetical protein [Salmonella enterica]
MYEAARVDDPIYHTSALAGFLIGAIIGIAIIALAAFAFFSCGFLAGLILGFMADQIASGVLQLGEAIGRSIHHTAGKILTGSENVSTNSRPAARAVLSTVKCDNHIAEKRIAQGSENIYINSQPAARKDDHTECDAVIEDGSPNVFLGGGTQTVLEISSEIPDWLRKVVDVLFVVASLLGGLAGAWRQAAKLGTKFGTKCAAKFIGGELVGMAVGEAISGLFSNPVDVTTGQKILLPETDFTLPGRLPVTCSRFYASHLETVGLLGRGWRLNWETSLREDDEHITLTGVQGRELCYLTGRSGQMYDHDRYYYDKAGNLLDNEGQGPVMNNRLPGCGRDRYGYNEWGELTTRRDQQLEWNAQGQLTRVISGNTETHYGYDALGRRTRKATYGRHTGHTARSRTDFVWEGFRLLQENVQQQGWRTYLYDAEQPYTPVASVTGRGESRQVWYYHTDVTGTPQEVTVADGTLVWAGYIRGFGENAADISNSGAYFHQPLRLPGQYFDDETGLHYNLFRYYAPECGRFVSQDPIGLRGGLNLYQYAPNPIRWIDPLGLAILEHQSNFDAARRTGFENAGMTNPEDVTFSKVDPKTGTVVEFKGPNGAKVAYDAPHADMDVTAGHDKPHVGWQSAGKRGSGGANRGNITYDGPQHPHRSDSKGDDKC